MIPSRSQFFFQIKKPRFVVPSKLRVMNQIFVLRFVVVCLRLLVEKKKKRERKKWPGMKYEFPADEKGMNAKIVGIVERV